MKTISKQYFLFNYSNFRYKNKPCDTLTILYSKYICVWLCRIAKVKFCKHLNTVSTGKN